MEPPAVPARYEDPNYQPRWDRFIAEPSSWWEEHAGELTERRMRLCRGASVAEP